MDWYLDLGLDPDNLRVYEHPQEKLSHYSKRTVDIEYRFQFGGKEFDELEGIANRTDFDLSTHSKHSGVDLSYFDQEKGERWTPYVIEPAAGLTRNVLAFLLDAYTEDEAPNAKGGVDKRVVLRFDPRLSPVKAAVLPLSRNADLSPKAKDLAGELRKNWNVDFDDAGRDRAPLPPAGRDRHAVLHHGGLRHPRGPGRDDPGAGLDEAGAGRAHRGHRLPGPAPGGVLTASPPGD
jgi:glycyl-tRNA synthetase